MVQSTETEAVRVLVVTHGGWIREMLSLFENKLSCKFPLEYGTKCHQRLTPNTGIARFVVSFLNGIIIDFHCLELHKKDHLESETNEARSDNEPR